MSATVGYGASTDEYKGNFVELPIALYKYPVVLRGIEVKLGETVEETYESRNSTAVDTDVLPNHIEEPLDGIIISETENLPSLKMPAVNVGVIAQIRAAKRNAKTPLGRKLWEISARIVTSGQPLLGWKDIEHEIAERRGGVG